VDLGIAGKTALVTGGARSLGKQDALTLASEGCRVIVLDLNAEGAAETAKEIAAAGGTACGYAADITDRAGLADVLGRAEDELAVRLHHLDALVERPERRSCIDRSHRMCTEFERGHDPEVATTAS